MVLEVVGNLQNRWLLLFGFLEEHAAPSEAAGALFAALVRADDIDLELRSVPHLNVLEGIGVVDLEFFDHESDQQRS